MLLLSQCNTRCGPRATEKLCDKTVTIFTYHNAHASRCDLRDTKPTFNDAIDRLVSVVRPATLAGVT